MIQRFAFGRILQQLRPDNVNPNSESPGNPYSLPVSQNSNVEIDVTWRKWVAAILTCVAVVLLLLALVDSFQALELINQEYYRFWTPRSVSYGFELNGKPISVDELIRLHLSVVLTHGLIATGLVLVARWLTKNRSLVFSLDE